MAMMRVKSTGFRDRCHDGASRQSGVFGRRVRTVTEVGKTVCCGAVEGVVKRASMGGARGATEV